MSANSCLFDVSMSLILLFVLSISELQSPVNDRKLPKYVVTATLQVCIRICIW